MRRGVVVLLPFLFGCGRADDIAVTNVVVGIDAISFELALTKDGSPHKPSGGTVSVEVKDADYAKNKNDAGVVVCRAESEPNDTGSYRLATKCPALGPTTTRKAQVVYRKTGPFAYSLAAEKTIQVWTTPGGMTKEVVTDATKTAFEKTLPLIGTSGPDKPCDDKIFEGFNPKDLTRPRRVVLWNDAAKQYGIAGAQPNACDAFMVANYDMKSALEASGRLLYVYRGATCVAPIYRPSTQTYTAGSATGYAALVDTSIAKIICTASISATNQSSTAIEDWKSAPATRQTHLEKDLGSQIMGAVHRKLTSMSKALQ